MSCEGYRGFSMVFDSFEGVSVGFGFSYIGRAQVFEASSGAL